MSVTDNQPGCLTPATYGRLFDGDSHSDQDGLPFFGDECPSAQAGSFFISKGLGSEMIFSVSVERGSGGARVRLHGEMDLAAAGPFRQEITVLERDGVHLLVDLSGLTFVDSSGLHELVGLHDRCLKKGMAVEFIGLPYRLTKLFELTNIGYLITHVQDSRLLAHFSQTA